MSNFGKLMQQAAAGVGGGEFYGYTIDNSVRLDGSSCVQRTPSSTSSRTTWTFSAWVKPAYFSSYQMIFTAGDAGSNTTDFYFYNSGLRLQDYSPSYGIVTNAVFRDPSAWYHLVAVFDTTNATSSDRYRIYVNGERITSFSSATYPAQNYAGGRVNSSSYQHRVGGYANFASYWLKGYMAEVHFVDGTALDASSFGKTKNGVWIPKSPSVTYGTNGFYLDFGNSGSLGADSSGNGNNYSVNGLTSSDQMTDTPTNNFPTWNPIFKRSGMNGLLTHSEGNLTLGPNTGASGSIIAAGTMAFDAEDVDGWYWEVDINSRSYYAAYNNSWGLQHVDSTNGVYAGKTADSYGIFDGTNLKSSLYNNDSETAAATSIATGGVTLQFAVKNGKVWIGIDNTWQGTGSPDPSTETDGIWTGLSGYYHPWASGYGGASSASYTSTSHLNAGQKGFTYTPPTGFKALCTANLPEPTIGPTSTTQSDENFNTVLYTGTGSARTVTGVGFQPDWLWIKKRSAAENHALYDAVRGATKRLESNNTNVEDPESGGVSSFDTDGFSISGGSSRSNTSGETYVAWNWKGNGSGVSNTDGSITSTVSANTAAGFSIVNWTSGGSSSQETVGVGLNWSGKNKIVITKNRDDATFNWGVNSNLLGSNKVLTLNTSNDDSQENSSHYITYETNGFRIYAGGSSILNQSGDKYIAYCFAEVEGFSKFGTYTGNGSSDGPFIYTGFRPAFIYIKSSSLAQSGFIKDTAVSPYNVSTAYNQPDSSAAEVTNHTPTYTDILSNGFKLRGTANASNASGATYIYIAFAENPFKYANAR